MPKGNDTSRRSFVGLAAFTGASLLANTQGKLTSALGAAPRLAQVPAPPPNAPPKEIEVSPVEDLMREHGGLNRILLIYEEVKTRIELHKDFDPAPLAKAAGLIRRFIEGYHEKLEEDHLFPRLEKAGKLVDLVKTLKEQHAAGRKLTAIIEAKANSKSLKDAGDRRTLTDAMARFVRMYRPHEAREDTILFPAFKTVVTPKEYDLMGDQFEDKEHELFGSEGFEGVIVTIGEIERAYGVFELNQFTPIF